MIQNMLQKHDTEKDIRHDTKHDTEKDIGHDTKHGSEKDIKMIQNMVQNGILKQGINQGKK